MYIKEKQELMECSFKPQVNQYTPRKHTSKSPKGFEKHTGRMKIAQVFKKTNQKMREELGKPNLPGNAVTQDGRTILRPFTLSSPK